MTRTPTEVTTPAPANDAAQSVAQPTPAFDATELLKEHKKWTSSQDNAEPIFADIYNAGQNRLAAFTTRDGSPDVFAYPTDPHRLFGLVAAEQNRVGERSGVRTAGLPVISDTAKIPSDRVRTTAEKDVSDRFQSAATSENAVRDYTRTLEKAGFKPDEAATIAAQTYKRLLEASEKGKLQGTAAEQMMRMDRAHQEILQAPPGGRLKDGQRDYLTPADRQNIVRDSALRTMDPEKYVNQGQHMTCALHSMGKQELEAGDPARVAERTRDLVNNGSTTVKEMDRRGPNGEVVPGRERIVRVDSLSLKPDREASNTVNAHNYGDNGKQGPAGQIYAALTGQLAGDLRSEREGKKTSADGLDQAGYIYMAAHAGDRGARRGQTSTGEGMFSRDGQGALRYIGDGPQVAIWDVAHLNRAIGGADGAVFASSTLFRRANGEKPPPGYPPDLQISTFRNTDELRAKLKEFQQRTGQSGQLGVNAPFLPGGGRNGHGMHAMNIRLNEDGSFRLDNNWGSRKDLTRVSDDEVDMATNSNRWTPKPGSASGRRSAPDDGTRFGPGNGRNPNEADSDFNKRMDEQEARQKEREEEEVRKRAQLEQAREAQQAQLTAERERAQQVQLVQNRARANRVGSG